MAGAEIKVTGNLNNILSDLEALKKKASEVQEALRKGSGETAKELGKNRKQSETFFESLRSMGARTADQLRRDFRTLISLESLQGALKISNQFKNTISETIQLSDAIRKLGATFGMTEKNFASFQQYLTQGLGEIGLSSDVAVKTLQALAKTPVRSQQGVLEYSKTAGMLASIGGEKGREGDIAGGLANVIRAKGGNVENLNELRELAESVRRVAIQTGQAPSAILSSMESLFEKMPDDLRKSISSTGLANLAAAQAVGGPGAIKFLEEYLGKSDVMRRAFEQQGGKGVFTNEGIDIEKFKAFSQQIFGRIPGDKRLSAETLGLTPEVAEGFVRLAESLDQVALAQDKIKKSTGSLAESYRSSMGLGEAFNANLNRVKATFSGFLEPITQGLTGMLSGASESDLGAGAVAGGAGILAAVLAGFGARGLGKGIVGTAAKGAAASAITGEDVQPVYVVNAAEIGGGFGGGGGGGGTAGKVLGAAGIALGVGVAAREGVGYLQSQGVPTGPSAQETAELAQKYGGDIGGAATEGLLNAIIKLNNLLGSNYAEVNRHGVTPEVNIKIDAPVPGLKASQKPPRGQSTGPRN